MSRLALCCFALILVSALPVRSAARDTAPLPTADQGPLSVIFGLPKAVSGSVLSGNQRRVAISYEISNYMFYERRGTEELVLDGETRRALLALTYGYRNGEWGIEIPYLSHTGGRLDGFIEQWHDTFNQPQGGRNETSNNLLSFNYRRDGIERLNINRVTEGIGDIRLLGAWQLKSDTAADVALRLSFKLPTGESRQLHGSGAPDLAAWLVASCNVNGCPGPWSWSMGSGLLWLGSGDVLPELQRHVVAFGNASIGWDASPSVTLKAALYGHTPFYRNTDFAPLSTTSWQLILGGTWTLSARSAVDVSVTEDISIYTAPDVGIQASLRTDF